METRTISKRDLKIYASVLPPLFVNFLKYQRVWVKYCANHLHEQEYRPLVHSLKELRAILESEDCDQIIQHSGVLFWEKVNKKWREFATKRLKGK